MISFNATTANVRDEEVKFLKTATARVKALNHG
jgi:hypothetical protein